MKDRVYEVMIDGKPYIMKERKTTHHTDVKKNGHKDGLTSENEFETARNFDWISDFVDLKEGHVRATWEKPMGYVEFPDGYQFTMFESEPDLITRDAERQLWLLIEAKPDAYYAEYEEVKALAKKLYWERPDLAQGNTWKPDDWQPSEGQDELTFEQFARRKAGDMIRQAKDLREDTIHGWGYFENDDDGYEFRVVDGDTPSLDIVSFDFEYYSKEPRRAGEVRQRYRDRRASGDSYTTTKEHESDIARVAEFVLLQQRGYRLPEDRSHLR